MPDKKDDAVKSALDEILGIETDRVKAEAESKRQREEEERRRREEEERRKREESERRRREEEERAAAEERARRDEESRKFHLRQLDEMRVKQEMEAKSRLAEEELRFKHEKELALIDAQRKKVPIWVWGVIAAVVIGGGAIGAVLYMGWQEEQETLRRQAAAEKAQLQEQLKQVQDRFDRLERARQSAAADLDALQRDLAASKNLSAAEQEALQAKIREAEAKAAQAAAEAEAAAAAVDRAGGGRRGPGGKRGPSGPGRTKIRKCTNVGTPLEECFHVECPGDPRC